MRWPDDTRYPWRHPSDVADQINQYHTNPYYQTGLRLPDLVTATLDAEAAFEDADFIFHAVILAAVVREVQAEACGAVGVAAVVIHAVVVAARLRCRRDVAAGTCRCFRMQGNHPPNYGIPSELAGPVPDMFLAYVCLANEAASDRGIVEPRPLTNVAHPLRHWLWFFRFIAVFDHIPIDGWRRHGVGNATHNTELQRGAAGQSGVGWLRGRR